MAETDFHLSFYLICLVLSWIALRGILYGRAIFQFPTVAAMLGLAWIVPQGFELESNPNNLLGSEAFWLYATFCFVCIFFGFKRGCRTQLRRIRMASDNGLPFYNMSRLTIAAAGLTVIGHVSLLMMGGVETSGMGGQWTGVITLYALLYKANGLGLCLSVLIFAHTGSRIALVIALVAAQPLFVSATIGIRREQIFDLIILTLGGWYIAKGLFPSRIMMIGAVLIGSVVLNSTANLRTYVASGQGNLITALLSEEIYQEFQYVNLEQDRVTEIGQAQYDFRYMNETWRWELGADYWNQLVHRYVPAFLVGRSIKDGLKIDTLAERFRRGETEGLFSLGSTRTGFADSYRNFGVFGVLVFGLIGYIFGRLYSKATVGSISGQYFYLALLAEGLKGITHSTSEFFSALPFVFVISLIIFHYAQKSPSADISFQN